MTQSSPSYSQAPGNLARTGHDYSLPRTLGNWELVRCLETGPTASTYLARVAGRQDGPGQYVAKVLEGPSADDAGSVQQIRWEALVGQSVSHAHLVCVLDAQLYEPPYHLIMPWLAGETLRARLIRCRRLPCGEAFWVVRQVAEALVALHGQGWLHCDVKPENISIAPDGHATLLDLGFVRRLDRMGWAVGRQVAGTFNYMAPEMITSAIRPDARSDLYSLGVTLYEALSGRLPFVGSTAAEMASQHRQSKPECIGQLMPDLPRAAAGLVDRMLAKQPLRRPQSAAEVIRRLVALEIEAFDERLLSTEY